MQFRDLQAQYKVLQPEIDRVVSAVLADGCYIGGSPVRELEEQLADYVNVKHCITCGNGTDALQLALMAWGVGEGDAVFVPDFTFFSSGEVVSTVGAVPVFVDVDSRTFNLDAAKLEEAIRDVKDEGKLNPRVVIAVDLFGLPADYPALKDSCERHGLLLLEDGAQGFGGSIDGGMACSFGDISTTSFFPAKPLGCYGDGGAVFTDDDEWAALMRSYAVHGKGSMKYDNIRIGMNSRLDTIQAAILQVKLKAFIQKEVLQVNQVADWYAAALREEGIPGMGFVLPQVPAGFVSSWAQYTVQVPGRFDRDEVSRIMKDSGVPTMVYYPKPMHDQRAFAQKLKCPDGCPVTVDLCSSVLSLPMGPCLTHEEVQSVAAALRGAVQ